ncbi:hypothetical protein FQR65_LT20624 [Abscondita terminalis]|nr:hypothetical protein FQR65_LT20624 [Abscondita terminalis]
MITVAIVAILASVAYPSYSEYVAKGRRAEARAVLSSAQQWMERFYSENFRYDRNSADVKVDSDDLFKKYFSVSPQPGQGSPMYEISVVVTDGVRDAYSVKAVRKAGAAMASDRCGDFYLDQRPWTTAGDSWRDGEAACRLPEKVFQLSSQWMAQAIGLATQAMFRTSPNPRVGCVIVDAQGRLLGQGATQPVGGPHAEIMALRDAQARGLSVQGATAYVTLEPCAHHGRTGPCCDALVQAGIARVVASLQDPNPQVGGQGFARLRAASVEVEIGEGADQAWELNLGFFSRMLRARPWVRAKVAASLDGVTALSNGQSQWITSPEARHDGHAWRARSCAILTGIGTVLSDNPRMDVRGIETPRQPALVVVDSRLQTPPQAALFAAQRKVHIYTAVTELDSEKARALVARGAQLICLPNGQGQVDVQAMVADLARLQFNELHVEAGHRLNAALAQAGLIDEWLSYLAPKLLWGGAGWADLPSLDRLADAQAMVFQSVEPVGHDLRVVLRCDGADRFGAQADI